MKPADLPVTKLDYEAALAQLEEITMKLESEQLPLEKMLELYTRGQELASHCNQLLDQAELKVKTLSPGKDLNPGSEEV
jgi:exodeoxyribonuclease VII small subunit